MSWLWAGLSKASAGELFKSGRVMLKAIGWADLCANVAKLPMGQLWRHNQAGDLPHDGGVIDGAAVAELVEANAGKRGFTYTHHDPAIGDNAAVVCEANASGFTVNLSGNNLAHADRLADLAIAPVVCVLPAEIEGKDDIRTPAGRRVVVCPATYLDKVNCATCGLCQRQREVIVGFPAHGARKGKASEVAR